MPNPRRVDVFRTSGAPAGGQARDPEVKRFLPRPRPSYLFRELFGWNNLNARFLYVTDGGHYENLGLVELLRRECMQVYCFDASGGSSFAALGDAVALARSEMRRDRHRPASARPGRRAQPGARRLRPRDDRLPGCRHAGHARLLAHGDDGGRALGRARVSRGRPHLPARLDRRPALHRPEVRGIPRARRVRGRQRDPGDGARAGRARPRARRRGRGRAPRGPAAPARAR